MASLNIAMTELGDGVQAVKIHGKLDVFSFVELKNCLESISAVDKKARIVIDLSGIDFVASSGWSVLLSRRKMLKLNGGDLSLSGMSPDITRIYESMRIQKLLPSASTPIAAAKLLGGVEAP